MISNRRRLNCSREPLSSFGCSVIQSAFSFIFHSASPTTCHLLSSSSRDSSRRHVRQLRRSWYFAHSGPGRGSTPVTLTVALAEVKCRRLDTSPRRYIERLRRAQQHRRPFFFLFCSRTTVTIFSFKQRLTDVLFKTCYSPGLYELTQLDPHTNPSIRPFLSLLRYLRLWCSPPHPPSRDLHAAS